MYHKLTIDNKKVYDFYNLHTSISFEDMSCLMVDILKKVLKKSESPLDTNLVERIFGSINSLDKKVNNIDNNISEIFESKFMEFKKNYIHDLHTILENSTNEKMVDTLKQYNESLQDKTKIFFGEFFPKNNESITNQINTTFNTVNTLINSSETRLQTTISNLESKLADISSINNTQNVISENINTLITKFHGSSTKGFFSEVSIVDGLTRIYPYGNVEHVGNKITGSGDILLTRKDKPKILIENKEYTGVVGPAEINKFIDNALLQQLDGIMMSQQCQIQNKDDFEININGDLVFVFVCNMNYSMDKLRTAISIIDHLKEQRAFLYKDTTLITLTNEEIDSINEEYTMLVNQKKYTLKMVRDSYNQLIKQIETIKIPALEKILLFKYGVKLTEQENCKWCDFPCKNAAGVSAHLKGCKIYKASEQFQIDKEFEQELEQSHNPVVISEPKRRGRKPKGNEITI